MLARVYLTTTHAIQTAFLTVPRAGSERQSRLSQTLTGNSGRANCQAYSQCLGRLQG
jgi:hypothetical protein